MESKNQSMRKGWIRNKLGRLEDHPPDSSVRWYFPPLNQKKKSSKSPNRLLYKLSVNVFSPYFSTLAYDRSLYVGLVRLVHYFDSSVREGQTLVGGIETGVFLEKLESVSCRVVPCRLA